MWRDSRLGGMYGMHFVVLNLPSGFQPIRHYGLLASRNKKQNLQKARQSLKQQQTDESQQNAADTPNNDKARKLTEYDPAICPHCGAKAMVRKEIIARKNVFPVSTHSVHACGGKTPTKKHPVSGYPSTISR